MTFHANDSFTFAKSRTRWNCYKLQNKDVKPISGFGVFLSVRPKQGTLSFKNKIN